MARCVPLIVLISVLITSTIVHTQDRPQDYVDAHNAARSAVGVRNIIWNQTLADYTESYAYTRIPDCTAEYSGGPYGENLANGSISRVTGTDVINIWAAEKANYDFSTNECHEFRRCRNYTQVVWQDSVHLGCAKVTCETGGYVFICNYDPPGNVRDQRPFDKFIELSPQPAIAPTQPPEPFVSPVPLPNRAKQDSVAGLLLGLIIGGVIIAVVISGLVVVWLLLRWRKRNEGCSDVDVLFGDEFENGTGPRKFTYKELAMATGNFGDEVKLGEGGFGGVYKGFLKDLNCSIAVKKVSKHSKQGRKEYATEIRIISRLRHRNTVKLIGWCHERELILVYEFMPNGSLDSHLFKRKSLLSWEKRYKIVQGLASALLYLHEEGDQCVLHRDIKSSNVMLDSEFNAKLGDFGLARFVDHAKGSQTTVLAGTLGYMAPEYIATRKASKESDIFSFGLVLLEIVCGRRSIEHRCDEDEVSLISWVWESYGNKRLIDVADKKLELKFDAKQMECVMIVGLWCAHPARRKRPSIREAIQALNYELALPNLPSKMPVPSYDGVSASSSAPAASFSGESCLSLTVPR